MNLPRALAPWAGQLDIFPVDLATALGPMVQRLAAVVGPLRSHHRVGTGDPDGFHGVSRRGTYERLLISEWLLAEEIPQEFSRRAAMGEHLFLEMERKELRSNLRSVALFDAGPEQLGWPRVVHVALLIVLSRRAEAAGARFQWGVVQSADLSLFSGVDVSNVRRLLASRTSSEPDDASFSPWLDALRQEGPVEDFWLIGGRRCAQLAEPRGISLLQAGELIEPDERRVVVAVCPRGRKEREVVLEMPPENDCVRLLRDPFAMAVAVPSQGVHRPGGGLIFSPVGNKLLVRGGDSTVLSFSVPNSPNAPKSLPRSYDARASGPIVAVGRARKGTLALTFSNVGILTLHQFGGKQHNRGPIEFQFDPERAGTELWNDLSLGTCFEHKKGDPEFFVFANGILLRLYPTSIGPLSSGRYRAEIESPSVMAVARTANGIAYLAFRTQSWLLASLGNDGHRRAHKGFQHVKSAFFGYGGAHAHPWYGLLAIENEDGDWTVVSEDGEARIRKPVGRVVGTIWNQETHQQPALVTILPDDRSLVLSGQTWDRRLIQTDSPILSVVVNTAAPQIAYTTHGGEVSVFSLPHGCRVLQYQGGRP